MEVWIVDNASTDGSIEYLRTKYPTCNYITNVQNVGFAKANNQALLKCAGGYVLFLNPDTLIPEDCLVKCLAFMEANKEAGAMGIRMTDGSGTFLPESKRSIPSPLSSFYKLAGFARLFPSSKIFSRYSLGWLDQHKNHQVDVLAGAFMLARRQLLLGLNGFDEDFFMYGEDIDLSYRIQKKGFKNYYFGECTVIHFKGESTKKGSLNYVKIFYMAMSIFVQKHYSGPSAQMFAFILQLGIWLRAGISATSRLSVRTASKIRGQRAQKKEIENSRGTIIAGSESEFNKVKALLARAGIEKKILGRIATEKDDVNKSTLGTLTHLNELINRLKPKEIVFCEGSLSFSEIIKTVQLIKTKISVRFHALGSQSIVGSDSKDRAGEYISPEGSVN